MNLDEKIDWFKRVGIIHVTEMEMYEFGQRVGAIGLGFIASWDNGLKCYYVEKQPAIDLDKVQ